MKIFLLFFIFLGFSILSFLVMAKDYIDGFDEKIVERFNEKSENSKESVFKSKAQREEFAKFAAIVGMLRLGIIADDQEVFSRLSASEQKHLNRLYQDGSQLERDLWKHFFEGSTIFIGNGLSDTKRVGYHNAFVDGWVLTNWTKKGDTYRLTGLTTRTGEALLGSQAQIYAPWFTDAGRPLVVAFYDNASKSAATFKNKYPETSSTSPGSIPSFKKSDYKILKNRLRLAGASIVSMVDDKDWNALLVRFLKAYHKGDSKAIKRLVKAKDQVAPLERLASIPADIRASQRLMNVARRDNELTALYASPIEPDKIMFVDIKPNNRKKPELTHVLVVDLKQK